MYVALALTAPSCDRHSDGVATHRGRAGRPDQWPRRISCDDYQIALDTNGDEKPDLIKDLKGDRIIEIESGCNFDGQVDLVRQYHDGVYGSEIRDDDYDGRAEIVKTIRPNGALATVEREPNDRSVTHIVEYYGEAGHLTRREVRKKQQRFDES